MKKLFMSALFVAVAGTSMYAASSEKAQGTGWGVCRNPVIKNGGGVTGTYDWSGRTHGGEGCEGNKKGNGKVSVSGNICQDVYSAFNDENKEAKFVLTTFAGEKLKTKKEFTYVLKVSKDKNFGSFSSYNLTPNACKNNSGKVTDQTVSGVLAPGEEIFATIEAVSCDDNTKVVDTQCPNVKVDFTLNYDDDKANDNVLPLGIIGAPNTLQCKEGAPTAIEVYSGGTKLANSDLSVTFTSIDSDKPSVTFTIPNKSGIEYDNLKVKLTCSKVVECNQGKGKGGCGKGQTKKAGESHDEEYAFQVRPAYIKASGTPGEFYAEYFYPSSGGAGEPMDHLVKENSPTIVVNKTPLKDQLESKNVYSFKAYDINNKEVTSGYNSTADLAIISNAYRGDAKNNVNLTCGNKTCALARLDFENGKSTSNSIYTDQANGKFYLKFDNAGKTSLYGVDSLYSKLSQDVANACVKNSTSNVRNADGLVGCDIGFVNASGKNYIEFHTYKPAVFKVVYNLFNSPSNGSYGSDKFTYRHNIDNSNYDFENGKIIVHAYAIGASEYSFRNSVPLSLYDAKNYKEAKYVVASGSVFAPKVTYTESSNRNMTSDLALSLQVNDKNYGLFEIKDGKATKIEVNDGKADIKRLASNYFFGDNNSTYAINFNSNNLQQDNMLVVDNKNVFSVGFNESELDKMGASVASSVIESITFVDVAMLSPNIAQAISKGNNSKADVFLAGICSGGACGDLFGANIPGYKNEKAFNFSVINDTKDGKKAVFNYEGANHKDTKNSLDVIEVKNNVVQVLLQGDNQEAYCAIIRGCRKLGEGKYGIEFSANGDNGKTWHGEGEGQGKSAIDNDNMRHDGNRLGK